jgi:hypothetical protein
VSRSRFNFASALRCSASARRRSRVSRMPPAAGSAPFAGCAF